MYLFNRQQKNKGLARVRAILVVKGEGYVRNYIIRRLIQMIPVFLGIILIIFFIVHSAPGGPVNSMMDPKMTAGQRAELQEKLGLNKPVWEQFLSWAGEVFKGNFGYSFKYRQPVVKVIGAYIGPTFWLGVCGLFISLILGIPTGILSATKQYSRLDNTMTVASLIGISMPTFFFGLLLIKFFAIDHKIFPMFGMVNVNTNKADTLAYLLDVLHHTVLPATVLGLASTASFMRYTRSAMLEVIRQDYIRTARSKGLREKVVIYRHAFRNAMIPIITLLGFQIPALFSGAVMTEAIFKFPGLGNIGVTAATTRDYGLLMMVNMMLSILTLLGTLLADIFYAVADPRIKYE